MIRLSISRFLNVKWIIFKSLLYVFIQHSLSDINRTLKEGLSRPIENDYRDLKKKDQPKG